MQVISFRRAKSLNYRIPLLEVLVNGELRRKAAPIEFAKEAAKEIKAEFEKLGQMARIEG